MSNKYVNPTGDGYQGVVTVTTNSRVWIAIGMLDVDWSPGTSLVAIAESDRVQILPESEYNGGVDESIGKCQVTESDQGDFGASFGLVSETVAELNVEIGDDIRVYKRTADERLTIVPRAEDPFVSTTV